VLGVTAIGTTSINLDIVLQGSDGGNRVRGKVVLVLVDRKQLRAIPIPEEVRAKVAQFQIGAPSQPMSAKSEGSKS
jgi:acyl-CoA thioesterase FadM